MDYIYRTYHWEIAGQRNFGTDVGNLHRSLKVGLLRKEEHCLIRKLENEFSLLIDELQMVLDRSGFCSEMHIVLRKAD